MAKYVARTPPATPATGKPAEPRRTGLGGEYKRKKPRAPRQSGEEPPRAQRRKPLKRATPLPPVPVVDEALDDLERDVTRGFVEDLMHACVPPPSSLPLPTFSLARAQRPRRIWYRCRATGRSSAKSREHLRRRLFCPVVIARPHGRRSSGRQFWCSWWSSTGPSTARCHPGRQAEGPLAHDAVVGEDTGAFASVYANTSPDSGPVAAAHVENGKLGRTEEL
jgi:hypothetical protein